MTSASTMTAVSVPCRNVGVGATVDPPCLFPYILVLVFPYMRPDMALNKDNAVLATDP